MGNGVYEKWFPVLLNSYLPSIPSIRWFIFAYTKFLGKMGSTNWSHLFGIGAFLWNSQYGDTKFWENGFTLFHIFSPYFTFFPPKLVSPWIIMIYLPNYCSGTGFNNVITTTDTIISMHTRTSKYNAILFLIAYF